MFSFLLSELGTQFEQQFVEVNPRALVGLAWMNGLKLRCRIEVALSPHLAHFIVLG